MNTIASALPDAGSAASRGLLARKLGAEAIGTFALVFAGCGAIMVDRISEGRVTHVGVGLTFGLVIMVMIYAVGHISGAHFNPAVTLAFAALGRFPWRQAPHYIAAQVVAAALAALLLRAVLGPVGGLGATRPSGSPIQSLVMEAVITFLLMFVITAVATDARAVGAMAGWAIGGVVALAAVFAGPISGASMNPARSLGPAFASGNLDTIWIYLLGPVVGAIAGGWAYQAVRCGGEDRPVGGCC
jgi:aquaporin NIP